MADFDINENLIRGFQTAAIDTSYSSNLAFRPEFISNNPLSGKKVLVSIEDELSNCDSFIISVAFITESGLTPLLQVLKELERKGVPGKILTTDYLSFSEPKALDKLASLKNISLKMFRTDSENVGFHTKGYIFEKKECFNIIIGSSNMTLNAITRNREWNTKIISTRNGEIAREILSEFNELWESENSQDYKEFIEEYRKNYLRDKIIREQKKSALSENIIELERYNLKPNKMQVAFVESLNKLLNENKDKAMLLSATGTGKTYASAFAMREIKAKKLLFIVHREQIARQALESYRKVFGGSRKYGLLSGTKREFDAEFLFSTMQMMSKEEIYEKFSPESFDAIVLDECHHAGAESYKKIMNYFKPHLWLGMTASPDTNNYDIYDLFDHHIAYEIRLQQALEEDLLCPFHYFGITDIEINGESFNEKSGIENFSRLVSDERVNNIIEKAEYFGYSGERVKGLVFCSRKEEAKELSCKFNLKKKQDGTFYRTEVLTGEDSLNRREEIINRLTDDENFENQLDYIFTIDIFNEGVDIPEINQVIMLRPTESPVVFVQQLGRGLRKYENKEYVVVLDFIGNYLNNFMIPIALSGDKSYNKDTMRRYIREGSRVIPGCSTIHFDEISKKRIYSSIDNANTTEMKLIINSYTSLKNKLGRIPSILEFKQYGSIDIIKIFDKFGSYYNFLKKKEPDYKISLSRDESIITQFLSEKVVQNKRVQELCLLRKLVSHPDMTVSSLDELVKKEYGISVPQRTVDSVYRNLTNEFPKEEEKKKFASCILIKNTEKGFILEDNFKRMLENVEFQAMVMDLLTFGEERYKQEYSRLYKDTDFQLYQKYTYEDVCRLLGWKRNANAQNIGGYFYDKDTKTLPVFINYEKTDDAIAYEDRFTSDSSLIALSKHPRKITSEDVTHIYKKGEAEQQNRIYLFVRKNKNDKEAKEFYFLGEINAEGEPKPVKMAKTNDDAFEIEYHLETAVRADIYDYITKD